jgi:hypothetical protein
MRFGPHPGRSPTDYFWTTSWDIPADYPTGAIKYTIEAADPAGRVGTFNPPEVGPSVLTIEERTELPLVLTADMVRGSANPQGAVCVLTSRYQKGEEVVWRVKITDAATGKAIPAEASELLARPTPPTAEELAAMSKDIAVVVHLSDGQNFPMRFGPHGRPPADYFWTFGWDIPATYPTGTLDYYITADWAAEGKTGRWSPPNIAPSKLTVVEATTAP